MSFGLNELIAFPREFVILGRRTIIGQHIRFTYDPCGNVTMVNREPDRIFLLGERIDSSGASENETAPIEDYGSSVTG
jgi:hypothetical protein